jgi:hypothetical protein
MAELLLFKKKMPALHTIKKSTTYSSSVYSSILKLLNKMADFHDAQYKVHVTDAIRLLNIFISNHQHYQYGS